MQELLSLGDKYTPLFKHAEHIMQMLFDNPVFDLAFEFKDRKLRVDVLWTRLRASTANLRTLYKELSLPLVYQPSKYIGLNTSPDIRYTLARMLGMEEEPLQDLHARHIGHLQLTLHGVFAACVRKFGG